MLTSKHQPRGWEGLFSLKNTYVKNTRKKNIYICRLVERSRSSCPT